MRNTLSTSFNLIPPPFATLQPNNSSWLSGAPVPQQKPLKSTRKKENEERRRREEEEEEWLAVVV